MINLKGTQGNKKAKLDDSKEDDDDNDDRGEKEPFRGRVYADSR